MTSQFIRDKYVPVLRELELNSIGKANETVVKALALHALLMMDLTDRLVAALAASQTQRSETAPEDEEHGQ